MDKNQRREIKKALKKKELERKANDPKLDKMWRNSALMDLGSYDYILSQHQIKLLPDS